MHTHTHIQNPRHAHVLFIIISKTLRLIKDAVICILKLLAGEKEASRQLVFMGGGFCLDFFKRLSHSLTCRFTGWRRGGGGAICYCDSSGKLNKGDGGWKVCQQTERTTPHVMDAGANSGISIHGFCLNPVSGRGYFGGVGGHIRTENHARCVFSAATASGRITPQVDALYQEFC